MALFNMHSQPRIKAIIFDCDGTLVDSEEVHLSAWQKTLKNRNHHLSSEQFFLYAGKSDTTISKFFAQAFACESADELLAEKNACYGELLKKGVPPIKATVDFVQRIANEKQRLGLKLGVASAALRVEILTILKSLGIEDKFDVILSGHDDLGSYSDLEGVNKPKPYIYQHSAKLLNISPQECAIIEDSTTGLSAGHHAGCFTVAVPNRLTLQQDLSLANLTIDTFSDMSVDRFLEMVYVTKKIKNN